MKIIGVHSCRSSEQNLFYRNFTSLQLRILMSAMLPRAQEAHRRMRSIAIALAFFLSLARCSDLLAQTSSGPTIPTFHWVYAYLEELQLRHAALGYDRSRLPLGVAELDTMLLGVANSDLSSKEQFWLARLRAYAMRGLRPGMAQAGLLLTEKTGRIGGEDFRSRLALRSQAGFAPGERLLFFNAIRLDQELKDDANYLGKKWRAFSGYTEQAYVQWHSRRGSIKLGRDYAMWGKGRDASLLLSDFSRPLDQLSFELALGRLHFSYLAAKLDETGLSDSTRLKLGGPVAQRYLSANRISYRFWRDRLQLAISQALLNPFIFLHGEILNGPVDANSFGALDFVFRPRAGLELYGQLLIDDVQIERTGPTDLEPSEIGFMLGGRIAGPFRLRATTLGLEYTRVTNRTYNSPDEFAKLLHRRRPIGHFLGNDFDRWLLFGSSSLGKDLFASWDVERRRRGEGRVDAPFDMPWLNHRVSEGYDEKFPSGVVEKMLSAGVEVRWHPRPGWFLSLHVIHSQYDNFQNRQGAEKNLTEVFVRGWWEIDWFFGIE
jgi:hypothetical protein